MKWRYDNTSDTFSIRIGDFLSSRSLILSDIVSSQYLVKVRKSDEDSSSLVTLTVGNGLTLVPAVGIELETVQVAFSSEHFAEGLLDITECIKEPYYAGLGIKTSGMAKFLEIDLVDNRLEIVQDFIHD